jgi:hypothetical protein
MALSGCETTAIAVYGPSHGTDLAPLPNRDVAALTPRDIITAMARAGFEKETILELGPRLRNYLAETGAAGIRIGAKTEALFAVIGQNLHVSSRRRGSFVYDLKHHCCR